MADYLHIPLDVTFRIINSIYGGRIHPAARSAEPCTTNNFDAQDRAIFWYYDVRKFYVE